MTEMITELGARSSSHIGVGKTTDRPCSAYMYKELRPIALSLLGAIGQDPLKKHHNHTITNYNNVLSNWNP
jgi:hypothetical protein